MRLVTSEHSIWGQGFGAPHKLKMMRDRHRRPAVGFEDPLDVLNAPYLLRSEKREILAAWASDASAVKDEPTLRWLLGTPEPVPLDDVLAALASLDTPGGCTRPTRGGEAAIPF
jgi:hypothetical protein